NHAAVRAWRAETGVVGHDEQNIGRAFGRHDARRPPRLRLESVVLDHASKFRIRRRELLSANGCRRAGRARRAGGLYLCRGGRAAAMTAAASIPPKRIFLADFIGINLVCCCLSNSSEEAQTCRACCGLPMGL